MKNKNSDLISSKSITAALAIMLSPLSAHAGDYVKSSAMSKDVEGNQAQEVSVSEGTYTVADLKGRSVRNTNDEKLGSVEDVIYDMKTTQATHLVVATDNWFDGKSAVVPLTLIRISDEDDASTPRILLDMSEKDFDAVATLEPKTDLEGYLKTNRKTLAKAYGVKSSDLYTNHRDLKLASELDRDKFFKKSDDWKREDGNWTYQSYEQNPFVEIDGTRIDADELKGMPVVNYGDERLGAIVDFAMGEEDSKPSYMIVRTDNWFDDKFAVVPIDSLRYHADSSSPHPQDGANWWTGEHVVLDMSEETFDKYATYERDMDLAQYLDEKGDAISEQFAASDARSPKPVYATSYIFVYSIPVDEMSDYASKRDGRDDAKGPIAKLSHDRILVNGEKVPLAAMRGAAVHNDSGFKIATISDVVYDTKTKTPQFLVVAFDDGAENALLPISVGESDDGPGLTPFGVQRVAPRWIDGALHLNMRESDAAEWMTFEDRSDFRKFMRENAEELSENFDLDADDLRKGRYQFAFEPIGRRTAAR